MYYYLELDPVILSQFKLFEVELKNIKVSIDAVMRAFDEQRTRLEMLNVEVEKLRIH